MMAGTKMNKNSSTLIYPVYIYNLKDPFLFFFSSNQQVSPPKFIFWANSTQTQL